MRILLTGATGYIGSSLASFLSQQPECELAFLARSPGKLLDAYVYDGHYKTVLEAFKIFQPELVIHCAAKSQYAVNGQVDDLVGATYQYAVQILEAMQETGCHRLINTGSYWQADGQGGLGLPCLYAVLKNATEAAIAYYVQEYPITAITLRLMDTYGPHDPRPKLLPALLERLDQAIDFPVTSGDQLLDYVYIDDILQAYWQAVQLLLTSNLPEKHSVFYVSSQTFYSLRRIIETLLVLAKSPLRMQWGAKAAQVLHNRQPYVGDILPGWQASTTLEQGLSFLIQSKGNPI